MIVMTVNQPNTPNVPAPKTIPSTFLFLSAERVEKPESMVTNAVMTINPILLPPLIVRSDFLNLFCHADEKSTIICNIALEIIVSLFQFFVEVKK